MAGIQKLTDTQIRGMADGEYLGDGGSLFIRRRGDRRSWFFRFKVPLKAKWAKAEDFSKEVVKDKATGERVETGRILGKPIEISLGSYPALSLAKARDKAAEVRAVIAEDRDPREQDKDDAGAQAPKPTFKQYAEDYIRDNEGGWRNPKHKAQWRNTIIGDGKPAKPDKPAPEPYAKPLWNKRPGDITVSDIHKLLSPLWATKTETATRLRQRVETVLDYAFVIEDIDRRNPARWKGNLDKLLPKPRKITKVKNFAAPDWRLVPDIMGKLRDKPDVMSALALRFSILTAARSTEVRDSTWDEVDFEAATWTLASERTKNEEMHVVPLCEEALGILTDLKAKADLDQPRIFPGAKGGLLSDVAINKVLHAAMPGITAHGIARSSFRTWVSEATSFPGVVAEAALNHKQKNAVEAVYNRTTYFDKRIDLMKSWGEFLKVKDNVVEIGIAKTG